MTVDIIMPCYYSNEVISPGLAKIAQQTIIDDITLIIVNDCSPNTDCKYQDLIALYKDKIHIRYFETKVNGGPGMARQLGLDNATADWVMFQDDDDELYANDTVEKLLLCANNSVSATGKIQLLYENGTTQTWELMAGSVQGTIFKRTVLQEKNICFEPVLSFKEEDGAFSALFNLSTMNDFHNFLDEPVYIRKRFNNHISITNTIDLIGSFLAMIHLKAFPLKYSIMLNEYSTAEELLFEAQLVIPNFLYNLIVTLDWQKATITKQQFKDLSNSILLYIVYLDIMDEKSITINQKALCASAKDLYADNYFGPFNLDVINMFRDSYQYYLDYLGEHYVR